MIKNLNKSSLIVCDSKLMCSVYNILMLKVLKMQKYNFDRLIGYI